MRLRPLLPFFFRVLLSWPWALVGCVLSIFQRRRPMEDPVDFVVLWVDSSDEAWRQKKREWERKLKPGSEAVSEERFRDWDNFRYWFRAVEKFAPWVRNVYVVTDGQVPAWADLSCPKLKIVDHREIMPPEALPSFNSSAIEMCIHRIPGLSEHFVYFNDDMFLARPCRKEDFFQGGRPLLCSASAPVHNDPTNEQFHHMQFSTAGVVRRLDWPSWMWRHPARWFNIRNGIRLINNVDDFQRGYISGLYYPHMAIPFRKSSFERAWQWLGDAITKTVLAHFRTAECLYQQIFAYVDLYRADFVPCTIRHFGYFTYDLEPFAPHFSAVLSAHKYICICLNDSFRVNSANFEATKAALLAAFEKELPDKSSFER